jgi:hypothetical protein
MRWESILIAAIVRPRRHGETLRRHGERPGHHGEPPRRYVRC